MNVKIRKLTKAEALAESEKVLKRHAEMLAEWERRHYYKSKPKQST